MHLFLYDFILDKTGCGDVSLGELPGTCCPYSRVIIKNFDESKVRICRDLGVSQPASIRGILLSKNILYFISFESYAMSGQPSDKPIIDFDTYLKLILTGDVIAKIENSIKLIAHYYTQIIGKDLSDEFIDNGLEKISPIVLNDMTERDSVIFRLSILDKISIQSKHPLLGELLIHNCKSFEEEFGGSVV